jgi:hypothetical protein
MASMTTLSITTALVLTSLLMLLIPSHMIDQDKISKNALAQTSGGAENTFEMNGQISYLVLGMPPNTKTVI